MICRPFGLAGSHLHPGERLDDLRIKMLSSAPSEFGNRGRNALAGMISAVAGHRIEGVGDSEDASIAIDLVAPQTERVTRSIPALVVLTDDQGRAAQKIDTTQYLLAD